MPLSISDPSGTPGPPPSHPLRWPADYYASETPAPVLPSWTTYGCGAAAVAVLLLVFAGGAWLSRGGFAQFLDLAFGMSLGEMRGMYAPDVTALQKQQLETEIEALRENVRAGRLPPASLQRLLQTLQKTMSDEKLTGAEVGAITTEARNANHSVRNTTPPGAGRTAARPPAPG